jgi:hypothetical protein
MPSDSSEVDTALVAKLAGDGALMALMPGGVAWDVATAGATKFVIVSQVEHEDHPVMPNRTGWERFVYLVKAVTNGPSGTEVRQAAARIQALLQHGTLTPVGYALIAMQRTMRIRYLEIDEATDQRWQHRGGHYEVLVSPFVS